MKKKKSLQDLTQNNDALPTIRFHSDNVAATIDELEAKLYAANAPIYVRAGVLVQPLWADLRNAKGNKVKSSYFKPITYKNLAYMLTKHVATFEKFNLTQDEWVGCVPPEIVLNGLLELGHWKFPRVTGIINAPTLRPDGSIIDVKGYDASTQLYYEPDNNIVLPPIPQRPSKDEAHAALEKLKALLVEVPFVSDLDRAVALAAILTAVARGGFGVAPMILFLAHEAGSGKSYLVDLISAIIRGRDAPVIAGSAAKEEMEKRIGSLLLEGTPFISFDNLTGDLEGEVLCQMCTQTTVRVRILGKSEAPECEWRGVLCATGNNVRLKGDMTRRGLICNLDPGVERPEQRTFKQDPICAVAADRGAYLAAALTVVRGYLASGKKVECTSIGSYGGWSRFVREPLIWLDEEDPVKSMDQARADDPERGADSELIEYWREHCGVNQAHKANQVIEIATAKRSSGVMVVGAPDWVYTLPEFQALLVANAYAPNRRDVDPQKFGAWLRRLQGKVIGGHRLMAETKSKGHGNSWLLQPVETK